MESSAPVLFTALNVFANQFSIDFGELACPSKAGSNSEFCECQGFGQHRFRKIILKIKITYGVGLESFQEKMK